MKKIMYIKMDLTPVELRANYVCHIEDKPYDVLQTWYVNHAELESDFKKVLKPLIKEFLRHKYLPDFDNDLLVKYCMSSKGTFDDFFINCANDGFPIRDFVNDTLKERVANLDEQIDTFDEYKIGKATEMFLDNFAETLFEETIVDRHDGGFGLVAACTNFLPFGGIFYRGDS